MSTRTYTVTGMTCSHCVASVTEEVADVPGVSDVHVDLDSGALRLTADDAVTRERIAAAVADAGYALA